MNVQASLNALAESLKGQDEEYIETHAFKSTQPVTTNDVEEAAKRLGQAIPPSLGEAMIAHGAFTLGDACPATDSMSYKSWPPSEWRLALDYYADVFLGCDPDPEEVADEAGMEADDVAVLSQIVLIGLEGDEDYIGFDLRTRAADEECTFHVMLFEDSEIEEIAGEKPERQKGPGYDKWLAKHIEDRS